jgi:hypothetical protein
MARCLSHQCIAVLLSLGLVGCGDSTALKPPLAEKLILEKFGRDCPTKAVRKQFEKTARRDAYVSDPEFQKAKGLEQWLGNNVLSAAKEYVPLRNTISSDRLSSTQLLSTSINGRDTGIEIYKTDSMTGYPDAPTAFFNYQVSVTFCYEAPDSVEILDIRENKEDKSAIVTFQMHFKLTHLAEGLVAAGYTTVTPDDRRATLAFRRLDATGWEIEGL